MKTKLTLILAGISFLLLTEAYGQIGDPPPMSITPNEESLKAAEELLVTQHMDKQIVAIFNKVFNLASANVAADYKQKYLQVSKGFIDKYAIWNNFKKQLIETYANVYTAQELKQLTSFYKTSVGQKLAENQIETNQSVTSLITTLINAHKQELADAFKN